MTKDDMDEAIENVADAGRTTGAVWQNRAAPQDDEIEATRQTIRRFLEIMPEDVTVQEMLEALGGIPT